jgi:hypothetical protein
MILSSNTLKFIADPQKFAIPHSESHTTTLLHPPPSARISLNHPNHILHTFQPNVERSFLPRFFSHASPNIANIAAPLPQPLGTNPWHRNPLYNRHHELWNPHQPPQSPYSEFSDYRPPSSRNSPSIHTIPSPSSTPISFHSQTPTPSDDGFEEYYPHEDSPSDDDDNYPQDQDQQVETYTTTKNDSELNDMYENHDFYSEEEDDQHEDNNDYESTCSSENDWDYQ